jgi:hypothetical protein
MATKLRATCESHFLIECRACSRPLRVPQNLLDELVVCCHCNFEFVAYDPSSPSTAASADFFIRRVDELLAKCSEQFASSDAQLPT